MNRMLARSKLQYFKSNKKRNINQVKQSFQLAQIQK
jgi:hypothetical protein